MADESAEEFESFWKMWSARYQPSNDYDLFLLTAAVDAAWRLRRSERALARVEAALYAEQSDPALWTPEQHKSLQTFRRYHTADTNAFQKAVRMIDSIKKAERQNHILADRIAEMEINNFLQPENRREAKNRACALVDRPYTLPTNRQDGGCTCPPCLVEWGIREYDRLNPRAKRSESGPGDSNGSR